MNAKLLNKIKTVSPSSDEEKKNILDSILNILKNNILLTLSTTQENKPHSCSSYYVCDKELNIYIWTEKNSLHTKHMRKNPEVSINIADTSQKWGSFLKGLQISGKASKVSKKELTKAGSLYIKKFPKVSIYIKKIIDFVSGKFESEMYKFKIEKIKVLDEGKFGKEEYKEILINQ